VAAEAALQGSDDDGMRLIVGVGGIEEQKSIGSSKLESLNGTTIVQDCEEIEDEPVKTPIVRQPKSNYVKLADPSTFHESVHSDPRPSNNSLNNPDEDAEEISLSEGDQRKRRQFWVGKDLISRLL
jgi:hypothetical protein